MPPDPSSIANESFSIPIGDVAHVRALLIAAARQRQPVSYSELLTALGHRFTRPKMRALCKTLDAIDEAARHDGEPELAVLVVREADGLPGQGWWIGGHVLGLGYDGPWSGRQAAAFIQTQQKLVFDHWASRPTAAPPYS